MLDIYLFREKHEIIRADHDKRGLPHDKIDQVIQFDKLWLSLQHQTNQLRQKKNTAAKGISEAKKAGDEAKAKAILSEVASLGKEISKLEQQTEEALDQRDTIRMSIPNILHDAVPQGADESGNTVHSTYGEKPQFDLAAHSQRVDYHE